MPKFHILVAHIADFVRYYGYYGVFSEECFEHYQAVSRDNRSRHSPNKCSGAQIVEDLQRTWCLSSPKVAIAQIEAENERIRDEHCIRKRKFSSVDEREDSNCLET